MLLALLVRTQTQTLLATSTPGPTPTFVPTPTPTPTSTPGLKDLTDRFTDGFTRECSSEDLSICGLGYKATGSQRTGQVLEVVLGVPLRILLIVALAFLLRRTLHRVIDRMADRIAAGPHDRSDTPRPTVVDDGTGRPPDGPARVSPVLITRREARARTLASVLSSTTTVLIVVLAALMVLQELSLPIAPLLAGASVLGVALGLGAQSLVRDIVAGMFMIAEDQYGVGDVVDVGEATGSVEAVGLRVTRLRDVNGTVWYVRNGEILRVGNQSQGWARTVLDVNVGLGEDLDAVEAVLLRTARELRADPVFGPYLLAEPEVWGVESLTTDGVLMRVVVKTQPMQQWPVARELRRRIKYRFDADGIEMKSSPHPVVVDDDQDRPHRNRTHDALE